jgi:hypothetical protein
MEEIDIWRSATTLIKALGFSAAAFDASHRARELCDKGDDAGAVMWKLIEKKIGELERIGYARLTQAFSKKVENHVYAFALHTMYHNFVKIGGAHRMTPAQVAGVDSRLWEMSDIVKVIEDWEVTQSHVEL